MQNILEAWKQLEGSVTTEGNVTALSLCINLILAGVLALYVRCLYRWCSKSASDTESISRTFPLLALITTAVIAVVKSSLALSLGLVGALSIVRFRAAIKDPEELVYLFLCIAIGLAMGAEQPLLAAALVGVASLFIFGMHLMSGKNRSQQLMLTISGDAEKYFGDGATSVMSVLQSVAGNHTLHRFDIDKGRGQVRVALESKKPEQLAGVINELKQRLSGCDFSYVNLNAQV
ncbi:MAG: hypothetical protein CMJ78_17750 [Planctomycetaceae bacterium]|nr:hypothetical protein [Planctomycetaceae bacterium]